jgi:Dyp-type peroxidase family
MVAVILTCGQGTMNDIVIDYKDIQGVVRYSHIHLTQACFLLLRVENAAAARSWLRTLHITTAQALASLPEAALQVAFTCEGLQALGVAADIIQQFSPEFVAGMSEDSRSRRLGDVGPSAPQHWLWGRSGKVPHVLLMLYAQFGKVVEWAQTLVEQLTQAGLALSQHLLTAEYDGREPFGFVDGISQPELDWKLQRHVGEKDQVTYGNLVSLGEFLLGYPNEYGKYTERPLVGTDPGNVLYPARDQPTRRDLGLNGTYLVFRHLQQDVQGFWQFVQQQANNDPTVRDQLAAAMVGRTKDGSPLVSPDDPTRNNFTFTADSNGERCPFGAHIRRANPRTADVPDGTRGLVSHLLRTLGFCRESIRTDAVASARFHRLLRRGRKFGRPLSAEQALQSQQRDGEERGLYFICLNANISRQFEFVQNAWIMGTKFNGLTNENDPLIGNRTTLAGAAADTFSRPQHDEVPRRITGIPQFVRVRGGAYFFLPSIRAMQYLGIVNDP